MSVSAKTAASVGKPAHIHLEVETGLHRTGFSRPCLSKAVTFIKRQSGLFVLEGVCSHFAGAESIQNYWRIKNQMKHFKLMEAYIRQRGLKPRYRHLACSAAAMGYPQSRLDMVRIGIMQYGLWPSNETWIYFSAQKKLKVSPLKRVIGWKSTIMTINEVARGEYIGYGTSFMAPTPMKIAIVPVGYSQGYTRSLSFKGKVLIRGRFANIAGLINMNSLMIDVTRIPNAAPGDEVVLIGHQGRHSITIASFNEDSNQLNNELLTRLPMDIPRKVVR